MKKLFVLLSTLLWAHLLVGTYFEDPQAVVIAVPVADAVGNPLHSLDPMVPVEDLYRQLPFSPDVRGTCHRIHQLLYNEVGTVLKQEGDELLVEFPHFFWQLGNGERCRSVWVCAQNVLWLKDLQDYRSIPEPISLTMDPAYQSYQVLTLVVPWQDKETGIRYSAGTRFVRASMLDNEQGYGIYMRDGETYKIRTALVERDYALVEYPVDAQQARHLFVEILRRWASSAPKKIPYVWGGCSYCDTYAVGDVVRMDQGRGTCWECPGAQVPHCGFDCSGLVLRAAQIVGLPYYLKNTTTLGLYLQDLLDNDPLQEGDLILMPGHVVIVGDVERNELIEAAGYGAGFGAVHIISLAERIAPIKDYAHLRAVLKDTTSVLRYKNSQGTLGREIPFLRLLKLIS